MFGLFRWQVAAVLAAFVALASLAPTTLFAGPPEQKGPDGPDIASFNTAQFNVTGFFKLDGITVDVSGQGSLAPPDQSAATYKIGPFTLETITVGGNAYVRSRFEPTWEVSEVPTELPFNTGPIVSTELLPKGPFMLQGQERVDGKLTTKWSTELDLGLLLALSELAPTTDETVREALRSLKASLEIWVGNDDRLLYKERLLLTMTVPAIEPGGDPLPGAIDMSILYSKHNQPVNIQAPVQDSPRRSLPSFPRLRALAEGMYRAEAAQLAN